MLNDIRRQAGTRHVGHAGTLDPLAEGILVVGIGREATKRLHEAAGAEKEYEVKIKLGEESTTDDAEGEKHAVAFDHKPSPEEVAQAAGTFAQGYMQTPPIYSALKVKGDRAYRLARSGKTPKLEPRFAEIKRLEVLSYEWPHLSLRVVTGPGVYIRAIARDIGRVLKTGGYVEELVRTRVGEFTKDKCEDIHQVAPVN